MSAAPLAAHIMHVRDLEGLHIEDEGGGHVGWIFFLVGKESKALVCTFKWLLMLFMSDCI